MQQDLILVGALANCRGTATTEDLLEFLGGEVEGLQIYRLRPMIGSIKAAFDWQAILGTSADVLAVAGALWAAYRTFVKPVRDKDRSSTAGLFVQVKDNRNRSVQFVLGEEYRDKDVFVQSFSESVVILREVVDDSGARTEIRQEVERSDVWVRVR